MVKIVALMRWRFSPGWFRQYVNWLQMDNRRMVGKFALLGIVAMTFIGLPGLVPAAMAVCVPSTRTINFVDGSVQAKTYVCQLDSASSPQIQVEFDRLSEAVAGSIIEGTSYPDVEHSLGDYRIYPNEVLAQAKELFDIYGTKDVRETCYSFGVSVGLDGTSYLGKGTSSDPCGERRVLEYLTFPDQQNLTSLSLVLPDDQRQVRTSTNWPAGWNFFYYDCPAKSMIECTILWRSARASDVADYEDRVRQYESRLGLPADGTTADTSVHDRHPVSRRLVSLIRHLTADGWPDNFMIVTGTVPSCGNGMEFSLKVRQFILEVAFVKNVSSDTIPIDGLLGSMDTTHTLRLNPKPAGDTGSTIPLQRTDLAPGETLLIPTKILFVPAGGTDAIFQQGSAPVKIDKAFADQQFNAIMATPAGTVFNESQTDSTPPVSKIRESFGPPAVPDAPWFLYGPSIDLAGVTLAGQHLVFDGSTRNFFNIVAGEGYGSCPFLYSFDANDSLWVWHGKIIHAANAPEREMTQRIPISGWRSLFSIREQELEVSYIRQASLEVLLADGRTLTLEPKADGANLVVDGTIVIKAGHQAEFSFGLPDGVTADGVKRSTLVVRGYYRPYSSMVAAHPD
jgi:hypothetical protein